MTKKKTTYSLGIVLLALCVGLLIGVISAPKVDSGYWQKNADESMMSARMNALMKLVDDYYVDKVDYDSVTNLMMKLFTRLVKKLSFQFFSSLLTKWKCHLFLRWFLGSTMCRSSPRVIR